MRCGGFAGGGVPHEYRVCPGPGIDSRSIVLQGLEQILSCREDQFFDIVGRVYLGADSRDFQHVVLLGEFPGQAVYLLGEPLFEDGPHRFYRR